MSLVIALPLAFVLPALFVAVELARFGIDGAAARGTLGFAGVLLYTSSYAATVVSLRWMSVSEGRAQRLFTIAGYLAGIPVGVVALVLLHWLLPPTFACVLGGGLPVLLCSFAGYDFGARSPG